MRQNYQEKLKRVRKVLGFFVSELRPILLIVFVMVAVGALGSVMSIYMTFISKDLIDAAIAAKADVVKKYALVFLGVILLQIAINGVLTMMSMTAGEGAANRLRARIFNRLIKADYMAVSDYHSGDVLTRLTSDVAAVINLYIGMVPNVIALTVQLFGAFFALYIFSPKLALLAFGIAPGTLLVTRFFAGRLSRLSRAIQAAESKYRSYMGESVQNLLIIKTYDMGKFVVERFKILQYERFALVFKRTKLNIGLSTTLSIGYFAGYFLAFYFGAMGLMAGTITFGTMAAFLQLVEKIQSPFMSLAGTIPTLIATVVSAERLIAFEDMEREHDLQNADDEPLNWPEAGIHVQDLSYAYPEKDGNSKTQVLNNIGFSAVPGEHIGICGTSGEGKTTLLRLLMSLVKPGAGDISFFNPQGEWVKASSATRALIAYVPQGNTLFSGTIRENLVMGRPDVEEAKVVAALKVAAADEFVMQLDQGLETLVGERGFGLSEGQAQRIAIARAVLKEAPVLILDEATSALDVQTELLILDNLNQLKRNTTCIMITHRPATLDICDRVYRISSGEISEMDGVISQLVR